MAELPDWPDVAARLEEMRAPAGPAECHGMLCGLLCAPAPNPATLWLRDALGRDPEEPPPAPLDALYRETSRQLDDAGFRFELLLPADDVPLAERTRALAEWCGGFTYGAGVGALTTDSLDTDSAEFLADVGEIGRADPAAAESGDEEAEIAYAEIVEYLRVGALTLRTTGAARAAG